MHCIISPLCIHTAVLLPRTETLHIQVAFLSHCLLPGACIATFCHHIVYKDVLLSYIPVLHNAMRIIDHDRVPTRCARVRPFLNIAN